MGRLGDSVRLLTCTDFFTEPSALEMLLGFGADVRVVNVRENFHPKVSYFSSKW